MLIELEKKRNKSTKKERKKDIMQAYYFLKIYPTQTSTILTLQISLGFFFSSSYCYISLNLKSYWSYLRVEVKSISQEEEARQSLVCVGDGLTISLAVSYAITADRYIFMNWNKDIFRPSLYFGFPDVFQGPSFFLSSFFLFLFFFFFFFWWGQWGESSECYR